MVLWSVCFLLALALAGCGVHLGSSSSPSGLGIGGLAKNVPSEPSAPPNDQPVRIPAGRLQTWLDALQVRLPGEGLNKLTGRAGHTRSLFTPRRLSAVADALSRQLARATPRQDVAIRVEQYRNAFIGVQRNPRVTAFRAFVRDGKLNLIFGTLGQNPDRIRPGHTVTSAIAAPSPRPDRTANYMQEIGSRSARGHGPAVLVLPAFAHRHDPSRPDWIVIDLQPNPSAAAPAKPAPTQTTHPSSMVSHAAPAGSTSNDAAISSAALQGKLQTLKRLHDKHLIDDALYRQGVHRLLQRYLNGQGS